MVLLELLTAWTRIGLVGFGGGPSMIPLMKAECVDGHAWMSEAEFLDALAVGNTLPGPIAAKMSAIVGLKAGGAAGAAVAFFAVMLPPVALMIGLSALITRTRGAPAVQGAMAAVKPVVVAMLAWTVVDLGPEGLRGGPSRWLLAAAALVALGLKVNPVIVVVVAMGVGAVWLR